MPCENSRFGIHRRLLDSTVRAPGIRGLRRQLGGTRATFALRCPPEDGRAGRAVDSTLALLRSLAGIVSAAGFRLGAARLLATAADAGALRRQSRPAHAEGNGADECQAGRSRQ